MPYRLLIIEDNAESREMLLVLLEHQGYTVLLAENGSDGFAKALTHQPDLVVTDLRMPCLSGTELIGRLRREPGFETLPILAVTASRDLKDDAITAGADCVLIKPVLLNTLIENISRLLDTATPRGRNPGKTIGQS